MTFQKQDKAVLQRIEAAQLEAAQQTGATEVDLEVDLSLLTLTEVPAVLRGYPRIKTLNLRSNQISRIENLPHSLQRLYLSGNPTRNVPQELLGKASDNCLADIRAWFADLTQGKVRNDTVKLLITGNGNVGKSSLVEALQKGICRSKKSSTHGILIDHLSLPDVDERIGFRVFDFGGQEIYHGTHQLFLQTRALQLIVFDAQSETNATTPDRITGETVRNIQLPYWVDSVKRLSPESAFLVVRNKMDDKRFALPSDTRTYIGGWKEADHVYQEVSATSGTGIPVLKGRLIEAARQLPEYGMELPKAWDLMRSFFWNNLKSPTRQRLISRIDFDAQCARHNVLPGSELALLRYLHRTGTLYYDEKRLKDTIIADQEWATEAIYKALDRQGDLYDALRNLNAGRCRAKHIFGAFGPDYTPPQCRLFLSLMESCGLCFPLKDRTYQRADENTFYVFPEFLRIDRPEAVQYRLAQTGYRTFVQQPAFLPYYHIQQLITNWGTKAEIQKVWRTGLEVNSSKGWFVLEADLSQHTLTLSVDSAMADESRTSLLTQFTYHATWQETTPGQPDQSVPTPAHSVLSDVAKPLTPETQPDVPQQRTKELVISYAREDKECAKLLAKKLSYDGLVVWYDRKIDGRSAWDEQIQSRFEACDGYVILISDDYLDKETKAYIHQEEIPCILRRFGPSVFTICIRVGYRKTDKTKLASVPVFDKNADHAPEGVMPDPNTHKREASQFLEAFVQDVILKQFL